ncbi:SCA7, zinc-binding domain-containing protein [Ampelomyces quisqualis]|uniref:SCA7, zinc-binding domain-containing protein n=1 Tax=Ampelomyces quisqualis TaxID=50730 RepID=A0A6A5QPL9_AMPQU|nr:SCA7, zinc-binding domain-containing protein [Ampelomyces quisqualis]
MAAHGARKTPSAAAPSKSGLLDTSAVEDVMNTYKKKITLKIKKPVPRPSIAGNWKESETINAENKAPPPSSASPTVNPLEEKTIAGFPNGRPLDDRVDTVQCKHCRRPVLRTASASHIRECLNKKQEKLKKKKEAKEAKDAALRKEKGEDDESIGARKSAAKGAVIDGDGAKKGKKRKIEDSAEKGPNVKKKKKDEPKAKGAKPKGPVDVERQCGVPLPNGGFCARSLTCKSHSMGLKRAVPGRSLPYDMLLAQYQKKNQAKQQRAAIDANAPLPEDLEPSGAVDSDEEKDSIMAALARHRPLPLATYTHVSQRSKYQYIRMKGMIRSALGTPPGGGNSLYTGTGLGADGMNSGRGLALGMFGMGGMSSGGPMSATAEQFPQSAGFPLSAGLDGGPGSRRPSVMGLGSAGGPRQILPGQLPGPGAQARKSSMASVGAS